MEDNIARLIGICNRFYKLATGLQVEVLKNQDPFFSQLSALKDFDDRRELVEKKYDKLGEGSSRAVYDLENGQILKLAVNEKGIAQNLQESKISAQRLCTNRVVVADPNGLWNIMKRATPIKKDEFEKYVGVKFNDFTKAIEYKFRSTDKKPKEYDEIIKHPFFRDLIALISDLDLAVGDSTKISSFALIDGKVVISDYGLSSEIFDDYYAT